MYSSRANPERDRNLKGRLVNFWGCFVHALRGAAVAEQLTLPRVVLSHLHLLDTFCWEPAGPSFHSSFPKATFANAQHCGKKQRGDENGEGAPKMGRAEGRGAASHRRERRRAESAELIGRQAGVQEPLVEPLGCSVTQVT